MSSMLRLPLVAAVLALSACATLPVPQYEASYDNVQKLKAAGASPMAVEPFQAVPKSKKANVKSISVRGNSAVSPVGKGFDEYLKDALEQELRRAELLSPSAPLQITGTIIENDLKAESSVGTGVLSVEINVTSGGASRFRKVISASHTWESSFVGAIAIPRAVQAYPKVVETLLRTLYEDAEFVTAVKAPPAE